ncbi:MAG: hypothetical protein JEZ12_28030 [Desulfobacterium sp.]|nr:hypothetical protein [Desulfobacterium sp.]
MLSPETIKAIEKDCENEVQRRIADLPIYINITGAPVGVEVDYARDDHMGHIDINLDYDAILEAMKVAADDEEMCGRASMANIGTGRMVA